MSARTIGVVTVSRSDYTIYLPILRRMAQEPELSLHLLVTGSHLSPEFGLTAQTIEADGWSIGERISMLLSSDTPEGIAKSVGLGVLGFGQAYGRMRPDLLVVLGDRFEMHAAALAALPFKIPVAHVHGGELTQGAIDDALRHSLTKLSHLHFVATQDYARRVIQLGEEPWRVTVSGAPALDLLRTLELLDRDALAAAYRLPLNQAPLLVTYHPVTLEYERAGWQMGELLAALETVDRPIVFTLPSADTNGRIIIGMIEDFASRHPDAALVSTFGPQGYFSMMACAAAMVGNSSSGLIEAPSLGLPVVNIGTRQQGRVRAANVIDVGYSRQEISRGIAEATAPGWRERLGTLRNPYDQGGAAEVIVRRLRDVPLDDRLLRKRFADLAAPAAAEPWVSEHAG